MKYQILIKKQNNKIFTYNTEKYELDNFFIKFTDDRGTTRSIPKKLIDEVIEHG